MAGPNAQPVRGHRKDQMFVCLRATFGSGAWIVDTTNTDMEFWTETVTDTGAGNNAFNFKVGYGAKRAFIVGAHIKTTAAPSAANGIYPMVTDPVLATGVVQVRVLNDDGTTPAFVDPPDDAVLSLTLCLETL